MISGGHFILEGNPKGYKVAENIPTKFNLSPRMIYTLKNAEYI